MSLKKSTICYATDHWRKWFNILLSYQICHLNPPLHCQNRFCNHYLPLHPQPNHILYLQLFLKVEVTPNKSSSWILISCFVKLAQSEHSLQNVHNKHGHHGWKVSANCQINATFFIFLSFKVWFWDWKFMEYIVPKIWRFCGRVVSKIHSSTLILTCLWMSKRVLTKSLIRAWKPGKTQV